MIYIKRKYYLIYVLAVVAICSGCEKNIEPPKEFVLPSKNIRNIIVDKNGTKWITTDKGIVSYDGSALTEYPNESSFNDAAATKLILEEGQATYKLWLCSGNGLSVFEPRENKITNFTTYNTNNSGILSDSVSALDIDLHGTRYIATSLGLSIFSGINWLDYYGQAANKILQNYKITAVAAAKNSWIYVSTKGGGVSRFKYLDAVSGATTFTEEWSSGLKSNNTLTVEVVDDTCQWYGTDKGVAFHVNELTKSGWINYSRADGLVCDTVNAIAKDLSGNIWFGTPKGISKLSNNIWETFTTKNGLVSNHINAIAVDLDGSVWVGTDKGISHYISNRWKDIQEKTTE